MHETLSFRPLSRADFPLLQRWLGETHVVRWWHEPLDLAAVEAKYGPRVDGMEPTHVFVIDDSGTPIGWIQWYHWSDYPGHAQQLDADSTSAGIDLAIGELKMIGRGLGPQAIRQFLEQFVWVDPTISAVFADPEENNLQSLRAFQKAGFTVVRKVQLQGEAFQRCVVHLSRRSKTELK